MDGATRQLELRPITFYDAGLPWANVNSATVGRQSSLFDGHPVPIYQDYALDDIRELGVLGEAQSSSPPKRQCSMLPAEEREFDAIVQLSGGFGNQLFQYAFGKQLEIIHNLRVGYDITFYKEPDIVGHNRLRLIEYDFDVPVIDGRPSGYRSARRLKWLPAAIQLNLFGMTYVKHSATLFKPVKPPPGLTYYSGLWQSSKYFEAVHEKIRDVVRNRLLAAGNATMAVHRGVVGFHVRRGDYLTHRQAAKLDYAAYLAAALDRLEKSTGKSDWLVSVYSDDPDWCEANLTAPRIEINRQEDMLDDFLSLMQCEHKIISNSTFAWWAAFLGEADGSLTLAPKRWHATNTDESKILRDHWIAIDV